MKDKERNELNARLGVFIQKEKAEDEEQKLEHERIMEENKRKAAEAKKLLAGKLNPATIGKYKEWLTGFIKKGGTPTHYYDYPMTRVLNSFFVATEDFELAPLHGSDSVNIIVPKGIKFKGGELGHSNLYFIDGFEAKGGKINWIPVYSDIRL